MTGTPAINNPFEIALIFNLLRPGIFPNSEINKCVPIDKIKVKGKKYYLFENDNWD